MLIKLQYSHVSKNKTFIWKFSKILVMNDIFIWIGFISYDESIQTIFSSNCVAT